MYRVMLVDDEIWSLKTSAKLFRWEEYGFEVAYSYTDAKQALETLKNEHIDVLLLDMCMPGISGTDMLKLVREYNKKVKIVILSGYSRFEFAQTAIKYDVFEYCLKPLSEFDATDVITRLKEVLDSETGAVDKINADNAIENIKFNEMIKYINKHYREKLYLSELAGKFDINLTYCCYLFKKYFNCGFTDYVLDYRMRQAVILLTESKMNIDKIAEYLNYDYVYFNKLFKKYFNKTPRQYRVDYIKADNGDEKK